MKRPLQLSLAIALALSGTDALALGLGTIHVNSKLNQPLDAEIPILQGTAGEAEGLLVQLAAAEDFDRIGLNRSRLSVPLEFSLVKGSHGDMVIKVTSKEVIREPFLDFLVEANWPKGRLLREYTVLLDPPLMAPATGTAAVAAAAKTPERAPTQPLPESKPKPPPKPVKAAPIAAAPPPSKPAPATAPSQSKRAPATGEYTVEPGDTLSGIARDVRPDESTNVNQLMLALLKQNPNAFFKDNINSLKRGAILRIPSADQVKAVGSASEAAAAVHSQIEDWRGGAASKPTLVADTGSTPAAAPKTPAPKTTASTASSSGTAKTPGERLELVPPKAGKDSVAMADRPGSGAGSAGSTELKSELARTKEALTSRDQEAGELKSRVKELEETKSKSDRLLTLKDSEIADLQHKLKELQDTSKTAAKPPTSTTTTAPSSMPPPTTTPATTASTTNATSPAATKSDKVSKEDIWGATPTSPDAKTPAGTTAAAPASTTSPTTPASTTPPSAASTTPASGTTASTTTPPPSSSSTSATAPSTTGTSTPSSNTTPSTTPASTTPSTSGSTMSPVTPTAAPTTATTPPAKPASTTTPTKPEAKTKVTPLAPAWYEQAWVKPAAIGAAALLLLAGLLGMRKRKAALAPERGSIAGAFGDSPLRGDGAMLAVDSEEQSLRDQLVNDPENLGLHLELLSLFYAERNVPAFEDAADIMHAHVADPLQPEWLEARAMGQELAPHNALFADAMATHDVYDDEAVTAPHATPTFDHDEVFGRREPDVETSAKTMSPFDFDLDAPPTPTPAPAAPSEAAFTFDNLPPLDFGAETHRDIETAIAPAPLPVDEDEFPGDDGVGTKLDLAKAYLDMGDPEGARSMLDEVLAEGNDTQKGEARRLMTELR